MTFLIGSSLEPYRLFAVTPVGLALLFSCVAFFFFLGKFVLPRYKSSEDSDLLQKRLVEDWQLSSNIWHYSVTANSPIIGKTLEETGIWDKFNLNILAIAGEKSLEYAPWRETKFEANQVLALLGNENNVKNFASVYGLTTSRETKQI